MIPLNLEILELAFIAGLKSFKSLSNKARKQNWPYLKQQKASGSPVHLYPLAGLPDELQIAWAKWSPNKQAACLEAEKAKLTVGRPTRVPPAVNEQQAVEALGLTTRRTYYQAPSRDDHTEQAYRRVYDGTSRGLCQTAKDILLEQFPDLIRAEEPRTAILVAESQRSWGESTDSKESYFAPTNLVKPQTTNSATPDSVLTFSPSWIRQHLQANPESLLIFQLEGDTMVPTLCPGDLILIDQDQQTLKDGLLYALEVSGERLVKRVELQLDGTYKLSSDNPKYTDQWFDPKNLDKKPKILGRVIWFGREL